MMKIRAIFGLFLIIFFGNSVMFAQTTAFSYQGKLTDVGNPANGSYQLEFKLFDASVDGNQIGASISDVSVTAANGVFDATLDFGAGAFTGADRFLEISVRRNANESYVVLTPREQISSTPLAIRSRSSESADNADQLGGVAANEYPTTASISNSFISNDTNPLNASGGAPQNASFNIIGNGIIGGSLAVGTPVPQAGINLDVTGNSIFRTANGNINLGSPSGETGISISRTNRADLRFDGTLLRLAAGNGVSVPNQQGFVLNTDGNAAIGTTPSSSFRLNVLGGVRSFDSISTQFVAQTTGGANSWARFYMRTPNRSWFVGTSQAFNGDQFYLIDETSNQSRMTIQPNGGAISFLFGNVGIGTSNPTTKFEVVGTTKTNILQITGGSDLAENFEIAGEIKPGMVVAIDPKNPGKLMLARGAYNRQVAGIVSGANNLSAGMILPNLTENEKSLPVALSGRVWVYADATRNAISAGDLLTTSDTPGCAMKVTKFKKANGAIIGKAMTELKSGTGLVLVLVALQ